MVVAKNLKTLRPDFEDRMVCAKSLFGGGGGGSNNALLMLQMAQQQAAIQNAQGQQLALASKQQASADNETASMSKPGLGRALLAYSNKTNAQTLGG